MKIRLTITTNRIQELNMPKVTDTVKDNSLKMRQSNLYLFANVTGRFQSLSISWGSGGDIIV